MIVKTAMSCLNRILQVFKVNPSYHEDLANAQQTEGKPKSLIYFGETRWNSKVVALRRLLSLAHAVNFVLISKGGQTATYKVLDEEIACMTLSIKFLTPICNATDKAQTDETSLRDLWMKIQVLLCTFVCPPSLAHTN